MELVEDIDLPNVLLHLDSYHMNIEESSLRDSIYTAKDHLG